MPKLFEIQSKMSDYNDVASSIYPAYIYNG